MPESSTLLHFALVGVCTMSVVVGIGIILNKLRLAYFAGLLCGVAVGGSMIASLFLEEGLAYPPERDWHHIMWAMLFVSFAAGLIQIERWQGITDASIMALATGIASQYLVPTTGIDSSFDESRGFWLAAPTVAAATNIMFLRIRVQDAAENWSRWVVVAQLAVVCIALMLNYGTLAGVALGVLAMAAVVAIATNVICLRISKDSDITLALSVNQDRPHSANANRSTQTLWLQRAVVPIALAAILLTICVRTYSYGMIAGWVYIPMLFLPTIVCAADATAFRNLDSGKRAMIAGALTVAISATTAAYMAVRFGQAY